MNGRINRTAELTAAPQGHLRANNVGPSDAEGNGVFTYRRKSGNEWTFALAGVPMKIGEHPTHFPGVEAEPQVPMEMATAFRSGTI
jgi:hypothetical protein